MNRARYSSSVRYQLVVRRFYAFYAIPGLSSSKLGFAVLALFYVIFAYRLRSSYADNARNIRGMSVIVLENFSAFAFIDDFPLMISKHTSNA